MKGVKEAFLKEFGNTFEGHKVELVIQAPENAPVYAAWRAYHLGADPKNDPHIDKATFSFRSIQGCRGVVVSYNTWLDEDMRGKGLGVKMQAMKDWLARALDVSALLCTTLDNNNVQNHHLKKFGWELFFPLTNKYTKNKLLVWVKKYEEIPAITSI